MRRGAMLALGLAMAATGCRHHRAPASAPPQKVELPALPQTTRALKPPDVSALPLEPKAAIPNRPGEYLKLTAYECRYRAVKNAPYADDLDSHPDNAASGHPWMRRIRGEPADTEAGRKVRGHLADDFRNQAAGEALDKFFQLAQAEGQFDLLAKSLAELKARLADAEEAERRGLADRAGIDTLRVQVLDLEAKLAQLEAGIDGLNAALRALLDLEPSDPRPLLPDDPLHVKPSDVDVAEAVRAGLFYRPDLNLIRTLLVDGGEAADDLADAMLREISPLLARMKNNPLVGVLVPGSRRTDQAATRRQLQSVLDARTRQAEAEIRAAALELRGQRLAATAKAVEVRRQEAKLAETQKRAAAGQPVAAELSKAKLDLWKSQGELLDAAIKWNQADTKLRKAMGLLVREPPP